MPVLHAGHRQIAELARCQVYNLGHDVLANQLHLPV